MANPSTLPRISASAVDRAVACPRQLAQMLDPERASRGGSDPSLRLWKAVHELLHQAHRLADENRNIVSTHLFTDPPAELSVEEGALFTRAIEHYDEAFGQDGSALDPRCGDTISRRSNCGRYQLTAMGNLLFRKPESPIEIRRVKLRARPSKELTAPSADIAMAALLRPANETSDVVAVVNTLWVCGDALVTTTSITAKDVADFRTRLRVSVDAALATPEAAVAGWWCGSCAFMLRCPAIPQESPESMLSGFVDRVATHAEPSRQSLPSSPLPSSPVSSSPVEGWHVDPEPDVDVGEVHPDEDW
jgi:hypothetical protein